MPSLKLSNPFRRGVDRPSLKERAAALKAGLARIGRRGDCSADQGRRAMMAGGLAAAVPLPALAALPDAQSHPDQALFDAEATMLRAESAYAVAREANETAHRLATTELGVCPADVLASRSELSRLEPPFAPHEVQRCRMFHWVKVNETGEIHDGQAWTPAGLRMAIRYTVPVFGRGGTTPKRIQRWRAMLPAVDAFNARRDEVRTRHRVDELSDAYRDAGRTMSAARDALDAMRATTPAGLAVLARHVASYDSKRVDEGWVGLLESAAAIGGADLHALGEPRVRTMFM